MDVPQGITVKVEGRKITVKGPKGEVHRSFPKGTEVQLNGGAVEVSCTDPAMKGTAEALIKNMFHGTINGYSRSMKLIYAHFPISIEVKGSDIMIKNFLGEKQPRKTVLIGSTKVVAKGQSVEISGPDKEAVGQTVANMRQAMRIKDKDGRVFQDGMYEAG
ncbi:MAG: 50S ribosomal protein L6 [Candidatus Micrarchaeota archaeon]